MVFKNLYEVLYRSENYGKQVNVELTSQLFSLDLCGAVVKPLHYVHEIVSSNLGRYVGFTMHVVISRDHGVRALSDASRQEDCCSAKRD